MRGLYSDKGRYWPSPCVADAEGGRTQKGMSITGRLPNGAKRSVSLNNAIKLERKMWPTPTVNDVGNAAAPPSQEAPVRATCATWATPTQADGMGGPGNSGRDGGNNLRTQVSEQWRTPNAYDGQQRHNTVATERHLEMGKTISLGMQMSVETGRGTLNPAWVAQLQGFPPGWLDSSTPVPQDARLAACTALEWPARPGQAQYPHEAPRVLTEPMKARSKALRALGNACCPAQCYPLFAAIVEVSS